MKTTDLQRLNRRNFLQNVARSSAGAAGLGVLSANAFAETAPPAESILVVGPMKGYTPQIGTLVSMLNYNRFTIINLVKSLSQEQLDHLHDPKSNTIGALIMHSGATETFYQADTFEGRQDFNEEEKKIWGAAMELGDKGRAEIKGHTAEHYIKMITGVREKTSSELKKKDDKWLLAIDPIWSKEEPVNTYWKWFHVCEHEANHRGQMTWLKGRLPGATPGKE